MTRYVVGNYTNESDAQKTIDELITDGYPEESLSVIANRRVMDQLIEDDIAVDTDFEYDDNDESLWERVKDFFGFDDDDEQYREGLEVYRDDLRKGNILVLINDEEAPASLKNKLATLETTYWESCCNRARSKGAISSEQLTEETIPLQEERLNLNREEIQAGEVVIKKRVIEESTTIEVPVKREEVVIERVPVSERRPATGSFEEETITIPLRQEQIRVSKEPVVTEEVRVTKRNIEDTEQINASLRKEELAIEEEGQVALAGAERS